MRSFSLFAVFALLAAAPADARLFWQTYGATVATDGGCAWNINQDYFVPRHCDSCRYDLLSRCKTFHSISPACKNLHPVFVGYCTPYGECHYCWRDHVYKTHCGCTPLRCAFGPGKLDRCKKHCLVLRSGGRGGECSSCDCDAQVAWNAPESGFTPYAEMSVLPNVEPFGGVILGSIAAVPAGAGAAAPSSISSLGGGSTAAAGASVLPTLGITPPGAPQPAGALPPVSSF